MILSQFLPPIGKKVLFIIFFSNRWEKLGDAQKHKAEWKAANAGKVEGLSSSKQHQAWFAAMRKDISEGWAAVSEKVRADYQARATKMFEEQREQVRVYLQTKEHRDFLKMQDRVERFFEWKKRSLGRKRADKFFIPVFHNICTPVTTHQLQTNIHIR